MNVHIISSCPRRSLASPTGTGDRCQCGPLQHPGFRQAPPAWRPVRRVVLRLSSRPERRHHPDPRSSRPCSGWPIPWTGATGRSLRTAGYHHTVKDSTLTVSAEYSGYITLEAVSFRTEGGFLSKRSLDPPGAEAEKESIKWQQKRPVLQIRPIT